MKLKVKKFSGRSILPTKATDGSAGYDLYACSVTFMGSTYFIDTQIGVEIPVGYVGLIFPRSSISNTVLRLSNAVGVIDSDYRGPITFRFDISTLGLTVDSNNLHNFIYHEGARVGQLLIIKHEELELEEVKELSETKRGSNGYGSTGV